MEVPPPRQGAEEANIRAYYRLRHSLKAYYLFLLLESFKLETKFINIQQDTPTITGLIPVEQILKNFRYYSNVLENGIHYRSTSEMLRPLVYSSVRSNHF